MKKHEAMTVGQIIEQAIAQTGNRDEYERQQACYLWPEIVGPTINRYTTRRWVERDVMHVCLSSAVLKNELMFHRARIIDMLNRALGTKVISEIVIH
ncbi:MAG: DUF721 domain-containing protein [Bacteroidales bacterium]|nr:DUF721 domain-containing protein [Bacteroidales bacterium]